MPRSPSQMMGHALFKCDDRTMAILTVAMLDEALVCAIKRQLVGGTATDDLYRSGGMLGGTSIRNDIARSMGFYGPKTHHDIKSLNWVRNQFAHLITVQDDQGQHRHITFDHDGIANKCKGLHTPEIALCDFLEMAKHDPSLAEDEEWGWAYQPPTKPRHRFSVTFQYIYGFLWRWAFSTTELTDLPITINKTPSDQLKLE